MKRNFFLLILLVLACLTVALANTQGPLGSVFGTSPGGWTNPTSTAVTDGAYATKSIPTISTSGVLDANTLGFTIPAGATINGIQVAVVAHCNSATACDLGDTNANGNIGIQLTKSIGVGAGTGKLDTTQWGTTDSAFNYGTTSDLWGTTWVPADINASGFGVNLNVENTSGLSRTASVDSIQLTVTFTPAASSSSGFLKMFGLYKPPPKPMTQTRGYSGT